MIEIEPNFIDDIFEFLVFDLFLHDRKGGFEIDTTREKTRELIDKLPDFFRGDPSEYDSLCFLPGKVSRFFPGFDGIPCIIEQFQKQRVVESAVWLYEAFFLKKHRRKVN